MSNLTSALIICLSISAMFILAGLVANQIVADDPIAGNAFPLAQVDRSLISCQGTSYDSNCSASYTNIEGNLPNTNINSINPTGITGTDSTIWSSIGSWLLDLPGIRFIYNVVAAPATFLKASGMGTTYANVIAGVWYAIVIFLIVSWWKGQDS